jgi:hypothetical protein
MALPKEVPALTAADMLKGGTVSDDGKRRCLVGWEFEVFRNSLDPCRSALSQAAEIGADVSLAKFNDRPDVPPSKLAAVWNKAMQLLGYVRRGKKFVLPKAVKR